MPRGTATKKIVALPPLQKSCCGTCVFSKSHDGNECFNCYVMPPIPVYSDTEDDGTSWERGAPVDYDDPSCIYYRPKGQA